MAYLNKIDINGRTYYLQHLTDGTNEARLPTPARDDELLLRSQVVNSVTSKDSQNGWRVPLSASQGYSLNTRLNQEIIDRAAGVEEEQARAEASEQVLTNNLNQEIQDRISDVNAEETRALSAEKVLTDNLAQEVIDRTNAVTTEQNRATAKENEISANLTAEINRAKAAEETNATAIATEQSRAEGIEANHESRIATMETFFQEADIDASKEFIDTLKEIQTYIADDKTGAAAMTASIQTKVDKVDGKGLSTNDYTNDEKSKLAGIESGANNYTHPTRDVIASGFYKIAFDELGHVSGVVSVSKNDIVALGVPAQDTTYAVAVAMTDTESGIDGLLSASDKAKYDQYEATIADLRQQIIDLKKLVEGYHPVTEPDPEPEPEPEPEQ